jgi:predicted nuclease of predicted toxin-antitoxin system
MRFKLDENLPRELATDFLRLGHEVDTVHSEGLVGATDVVVVQAASASGRILVTLDKGIVGLLRSEAQTHRGVLVFRPGTSGRRSVLGFIRSRLGELLKLGLEERVVIVGPTRIRIR